MPSKGHSTWPREVVARPEVLIMHKNDCLPTFFVLLFAYLLRDYLDPLLRCRDGSLAFTKESDTA